MVFFVIVVASGISLTVVLLDISNAEISFYYHKKYTKNLTVCVIGKHPV